MKEFILQNFNKGTIKSMEVGEKADGFFHRLITGFPLWKSGINAGELTSAKNDVLYPAFPSLELNSLTLSSTYGKVNSYSYPLTQTDKGNLYVITTEGNVLGIDNSGVITDFGQPFIINNIVADMVSFFGKIIAVPPNSGTFSYKNEDNTGVWSIAGSFTSCRLAETFASWLLIGDKDGTTNRLRYIKIFNTSFTEQTPAFDVGQTVEIVDFRNINDTYVAVIAKNAIGGQYSIYVWDGTPGNSYIKSIPLIGDYKGMVKIGSSWFIITNFMGGLNIYEYNGLSIGLKKEILGVQSQSGNVNSVGKTWATNLGNYIVIPAGITGETPYHLLFYNVVNEELFLSKVSAYDDFSKGLASTWNYSSSYNYLILFNDTETVVKTILLATNQSPSYYFGTSPTGQYQSNWINLDNIQINDIEIFYDGKPDSGGSIALTLETKNEYSKTDYASSSIGSITNSDDNHRKIFRSIGKECSKFRITLAITHGGTDAWSGAIKKIIIHYTPTNKVK